MRRPRFPEGVAIAAIAAITGGLLYGVLESIASTPHSASLLIGLLGFGYLLYLLFRSNLKVGRIVTPILWLGLMVVGWLWSVPLPLQFSIQILFLWLVRCLCFHTGALPGFLDLLLQGSALAAALWTFLRTGSVTLSIWSFFLVQALFVFIPTANPALGRSPTSESRNDLRFLHAQRVAEDAVRKLSSNIN